MNGIKCVLLYLSFFIICYYYCKSKYYCITSKNIITESKKISISAIIIFSLLFCTVNIYATKIATVVGNDRINYTYEFVTGRKTSMGLEAIFFVAKKLRLGINSVFYFSTFFTCILIFLAYKYAKNAGALTVYFLLCTNIIFFSFTGAKQTFAVGFSSLFFALVLNNKIKSKVLPIILIILSCLFHTTGFILIPIYLTLIALKKSKKSVLIWGFIFIIFVCMIFFQPLLLKIASISAGTFPSVSQKIIEYFGNDVVNDKSITFIKGIPFYLLLCYGMLFRKYLKPKIENYDILLFLNIMAAAFYLLSYKSYWMYRFTYIFYFPMAIFFDNLIRNNIKDNKNIIKLSIGISSLFITIREVIMIFVLYGGF